MGGLGIHYVRTLNNNVDYRREDGKNILTISKVLAGGDTLRK
jgi:anti-sigma regulatory factor (Ser/Thr protein kinase)